MKIFRIIGLSIVGLYLVLIIVVATFVSVFRSHLNKHNSSLSVVLNNKYANLIKLYSILSSSGIAVESSLKKKLNDLQISSFTNQDSEECEQAKMVLTYLKDEGFYLASKKEALKDNQEFLTIKRNIEEQDAIYRNYLTYYNADVVGYNYWISVKPTAFIFKMFGCRKKKII